MSKVNFKTEVFTVARDIYDRSGRVDGRDLDNWLEAERLVRTLKKIAGEDGRRYIQINVPIMKSLHK
ncbi:MAG TPA: DUF2934 domain-containing protein [Thermodesulfovibrionales bacterium]|nr:DUF2934 domain-containing protein [Thermodesulfovibrionales bacterium]